MCDGVTTWSQVSQGHWSGCCQGETAMLYRTDETASNHLCIQSIEFDTVQKEEASLYAHGTHSLWSPVDGCYQLSVKLPALIQVNEDSSKAAFKTKTAILTVTMPCL